MAITKRYKYGGHKGSGGAGNLSHEPFYQRFKHPRERCRYSGNKDYPRYGGSGITFDWDDYISFKNDMYESYLAHVKIHGEKNTTLDRIDNTKGYSRENCRWATTKEQARNKKQNRYITYKGETMILADWAERLGCSRQIIRYRLESGWTPKQIIETPINHANKIICSKKKL